MKKKKNRSQKKYGKYILVTILSLISISLILYPFISNYMFEHRADGIIETVKKSGNTNQEQNDKEIEKAIKYNETLVNGNIQLKDPFDEDILSENADEYNSLLNMTDDGVMGFIKIPCIDVSIPIYHGTSEEVLLVGAGHLQGTSLPIGGDSTHSVITGHTGLSSAKLFTDLTELVQGDIFFLYVMGKDIAYEVDDISVIKPTEMDKLRIEKGKDYCTLVTCTPYGVNSHRLLVRGHRIDYKEAVEKPAVFEEKKSHSKWQQEYAKSIIISSTCFIVLLMGLIIWRCYTNEKERKLRQKKKKEKI